MYTLLIVLHSIFCVFLILVILLQTGKGAGIGAAFGGGGSQTVFGPRGAGSFIGKLTGGVAAAFMITSLVLAYLSSSSSTGVAEKANALKEELSGQVEEVKIGKDAAKAESDSKAPTPADKKASDAGAAENTEPTEAAQKAVEQATDEEPTKLKPSKTAQVKPAAKLTPEENAGKEPAENPTPPSP
jgi:preprotein translocase subunit SecG